MALTLRSEKGAPLTHAEHDTNHGEAFYFRPRTYTGSGMTQNAKLAQWVSVTDPDFGALGDGVTDDSAAIQRAIDSGLDVDFVGKTYLCNNLTQSTNSQCLFSSCGYAYLKKNASGPLLTSTGDDVLIDTVCARGDAASPTFTGHNFVFTGQRPTFWNSGSRWCPGRALKATGGRVHIIGSGDIWQTTDSSGYDIEIGVSGTATLYHQLVAIYTSQAGGGILLTDVGGHNIAGGQFGKLTIAAGTLPSGVNGGSCVGARILGNVSVGISSAQFSACHFGAVTVTFEANTSGCSIDISNILQNGATFVNNGNAQTNVFISRTSSGVLFSGGVIVGNAQNYYVNKADGTVGGRLQMTSANNLVLSNDSSGDDIIFNQEGAGTMSFDINSLRPLALDVNGPHTMVTATASLPAAGAAQNGLVIIEDAGAGDRNLIIYAGGQRFRIDGGAAF